MVVHPDETCLHAAALEDAEFSVDFRGLIRTDSVLVKIVPGALVFNKACLHDAVLVKIAEASSLLYQPVQPLAVRAEHGNCSAHINQACLHVTEVIKVVPVSVDFCEADIELPVLIIVQPAVLCVDPYVDPVICKSRHGQDPRILRRIRDSLRDKLEPSRARAPLVMHTVRCIHHFHDVVIDIDINDVLGKAVLHDIIPLDNIRICHIISAINTLIDRTHREIVGDCSTCCPVSSSGVDIRYILICSSRVTRVIDTHEYDHGRVAADILIDLRYGDIAHPVKAFSDLVRPDASRIPYCCVQVLCSRITDDDQLPLIRVNRTPADNTHDGCYE